MLNEKIIIVRAPSAKINNNSIVHTMVLKFLNENIVCDEHGIVECDEYIPHIIYFLLLNYSQKIRESLRHKYFQKKNITDYY